MSLRNTAAIVALASIVGNAQAALFDRGGGLLYDDVLNVTWLGDANYAKTSGYDADGRMSWTAANAWAANLSFYDSVRNVNYSDWRLPTVLDTGTGCPYEYGGTNCGYNVLTVGGGTVYSELAHMYHNNLGFKASVSSTGSRQPDSGIFGNGGGGGGERDELGPNGAINNLQPAPYWSGTAYARVPAVYAWYFDTADGAQVNGGQNYELYAWAVRDGDVAAPIPEPSTYAMLLSGLGLLSLTAKRRRQNLNA